MFRLSARLAPLWYPTRMTMSTGTPSLIYRLKLLYLHFKKTFRQLATVSPFILKNDGVVCLSEEYNYFGDTKFRNRT
jgi:hypothetical protein